MRAIENSNQVHIKFHLLNSNRTVTIMRNNEHEIKQERRKKNEKKKSAKQNSLNNIDPDE